MWGKTVISGCVRTLAITTQEGDLEPSWGGKLQHQLKWRWGEGMVGKGTGSKTENIIILLYKSMLRMCLEWCMQSSSPREDVVE